MSLINCPECSKAISDQALACPHCGMPLVQSRAAQAYDFGREIIKAKVTLAFRGYGYLTLTEKALFWNRSASSYLVFGVLNAATDGHLFIPLENIAKVGTYTYIPGGGLVITTYTGQEFKIAFKHKKDFTVVYSYLNSK